MAGRRSVDEPGRGPQGAQRRTGAARRAGGSGVDKALAQLSRQVLGMKGVAGTAQGLRGGKPCVKVYLESDDPRLRARLPKSAAGVPVDVEVIGRMVRR